MLPSLLLLGTSPERPSPILLPHTLPIFIPSMAVEIGMEAEVMDQSLASSLCGVTQLQESIGDTLFLISYLRAPEPLEIVLEMFSLKKYIHWSIQMLEC
jgi:hypothetical protein